MSGRDDDSSVLEIKAGNAASGLAVVGMAAWGKLRARRRRGGYQRIDKGLMMRLCVQAVFLSAAALVLAACGGGGDSAPAPAAIPANTTVVAYTASNKVLTNPYRGFYKLANSSASSPSPLTAPQVQNYRAQHVTQVHRIFYLDSFVSAPISDDFLNKIRSDLAVLRGAGMSAILRFAYTKNKTLPYGDATKATVLSHIAQLKPVFTDYADVVKIVQAGFIGTYGEWYLTDHFAADPANPGVLTAADYQDRLDVVSALLSALPKDSYVQLRTPGFKNKLFGSTLLTASNAFLGDDVARVGFHNDCFLASDSDSGTFYSDAERNFMKAESQYAPVSGETCKVNAPRTDCPTALAELAAYHWASINQLFDPDVIAAWKTQGCYSEIENKLGYRFVWQQAAFTQKTAQGHAFGAVLSVKNMGWSALFFKSTLSFILKHTGTGQEYKATSSADARRWLPSADVAYSVEQSLCVPSNAAVGLYDVFVQLAPDSAVDKAKNAIEFGNTTAWDASTGYQHLGATIEITAGDGSAHCTP